MKKTILLTGSGGPAGVNVARSIMEGYYRIEQEKVKDGFPIPPLVFIEDIPINLIGTDINKYHIEFIKQYADKTYIVPKYNEKGYLEKIKEIVDINNVDLIHAQPDTEVGFLSENRHHFGKGKLFLPSKRTVRTCQDKELSAKIWERNGFPSVETVPIRYGHIENDVEYAFEKLCGFSCGSYNMSRKIWIRATVGAGGAGSTLAENVETAVHWVKYWKSRNKNWKFIAQPYLDGRIFAFQSVWNDGELITSQARERDEYIYPYLAPSGVTGTPVVAHTVHNEAVNECATNAVLAIDEHATGVFCVDIREISEKYKITVDDDPNNNAISFTGKHEEYRTKMIPMPTEINVGRFFTTSYFFSKAGDVYNQPWANMPYLMTKLAFDEPIPKDIPKYNILPKDLYWVRHIDCGHKLIEGKDLE